MNKEIINQPRAIVHSLLFGLSDTPLSSGAPLFITIMKEIKLTQGQVALVDDWNYEWLNQWKWFAQKDINTYYARRNIEIDGRRTQISMHTMIMATPKDMEVDHRNGNGLDNQEFNMRNCTPSQNQKNRISRKGSSKYLGVSWYKRFGCWHSQITLNGKKNHLGYFSTEEEAAIAYDNSARTNHGEFANLNFKDKIIIQQKIRHKWKQKRV